MSHGTWLRNRLPSKRMDGNIPLILWDARTKISFNNIPYFEQQEVSYIYQAAN